MELTAYLYDSEGRDRELEFVEGICEQVNDEHILWIDIPERNLETIKYVFSTLKFKDAPVHDISKNLERPKLEKFEHFYRFFLISMGIKEGNDFEIVPVDFVVAKNIIVTVHNGKVDFLEEFKNVEKGETHIGKLDTESFVASLLDLHIVGYFRAMERIEKKVDHLDNKILTKDLSDDEFLTEMLELRHFVSKVRRVLMPHRDLFYALSRPDFLPISESDSNSHFQKLNNHFENAVEAVESSRDTVLSLFDLYTTRASHKMNQTMRTLTFVTIVFGALGVIAGVMGMNFEVGFFKLSDGFWLTLLGMAILVGSLALVAKMKKLI